MNWIDFKKERPKKEPRRQVLFKSYEGDYHLFMSTDTLDPAFMQRNYPEWSEIEPPNSQPSETREFRYLLRELECSYRIISADTKQIQRLNDKIAKLEAKLNVEPPPKPDAIAEVLRRLHEILTDSGESNLEDFRVELRNEGVNVDQFIARYGPQALPKPDPFEEAFKEAWECLWDINDHYAEIKSAGRLIWDAAIKHAKGEG